MTSRNSPLRYAAVCAALTVVWAAASLAPAAVAQGFKWWQDEKTINELGLTPQQTRNLEETWQKAVPRLKTQKTALDLAEAEFEKLIERGDQAAMEQINVVEAARAELNKTRYAMLFNMRQLLTREQWAKFTALQQAAERERAAAAAKAAEKRP